ncbi:phage protein [Bergeriella denitrificans]|uniref:Phage protein n=1 Tax=Bergeriella denitrificans TaxID=494 RepID=A0A378URU7_BERDE|nr:phage protein [Bergeriella denitrificans]
MNNDVIEHEVMDVVANQNHQAAHSVMVMEQWGNGETYNEERWIERGRQAVRQTMEGMFELGRALIILKEHTQHGRFMEIVKSQFGIGHNETARLIAATQRFATPQMQKAAPKLMDLGKSKLLELLVEEDVTLIGLAEGEEVNGMTLDDVDRMTVRELRAALRESRETAEAKDKVIADKNKKVDELAEKLEKKQKNRERTGRGGCGQRACHASDQPGSGHPLAGQPPERDVRADERAYGGARYRPPRQDGRHHQSDYFGLRNPALVFRAAARCADGRYAGVVEAGGLR